MSTAPLTPFQTPQRVKTANNSTTMSTPLLVPPSPSLVRMGFGTGKSSVVAQQKIAQEPNNFHDNCRCSHLSHRTITENWQKNVAMGGETGSWSHQCIR